MSVEIREHDLEEMLLVGIHRTRTCADRYPDDPLALGDGLNPFTGAPESASNLRLPGQVRIRGEKLQREAYYMPRTLAEIHLRRTCEACSACKDARYHECVDAPALRYIHRDQWTESEAADVATLEDRIHRVFERWETQGMMLRQPPILFTGGLEKEKAYIAPEGKDQWAWTITSKGIESARLAFEKAGDWKNDNRRSALWTMTDRQRRNAPQWQQKEFIEEGGKISGGPDVRSEVLATPCTKCRTLHAGEVCPARPARPGVLARIFGAFGNGRKRRSRR